MSWYRPQEWISVPDRLFFRSHRDGAAAPVPGCLCGVGKGTSPAPPRASPAPPCAAPAPPCALPHPHASHSLCTSPAPPPPPHPAPPHPRPPVPPPTPTPRPFPCTAPRSPCTAPHPPRRPALPLHRPAPSLTHIPPTLSAPSPAPPRAPHAALRCPRLLSRPPYRRLSRDISPLFRQICQSRPTRVTFSSPFFTFSATISEIRPPKSQKAPAFLCVYAV